MISLVVMTSRLKLRLEASLDSDVLLWHDVWSLSLPVLQCLLPVAATNAVESCWKGPSTMECIISDEHFQVTFHGCSKFLEFVVSNQFSNDPAVTPIIATGHQLVTLCRSICAKERAEILEALTSSRFCHRTVHVSSLVCLSVYRIRWRFGSGGAHGTDLVSSFVPIIWNIWHQWQWKWRD